MKRERNRRGECAFACGFVFLSIRRSARFLFVTSRALARSESGVCVCVCVCELSRAYVRAIVLACHSAGESSAKH